MAELPKREKPEPVAKATRAYALQDGAINGERIRAGSEFILPAGMRPGKWMKLLNAGEAAPKPKAKDAKPAAVSLSQITKARAAESAPIDAALA